MIRAQSNVPASAWIRTAGTCLEYHRYKETVVNVSAITDSKPDDQNNMRLITRELRVSEP